MNSPAERNTNPWNMLETEPDSRDTDGPQRWHDGRLMYFEHQVQPRPGHWLLERLSVDELRALLPDALDATMVADPARWPLPPAGLPGKRYDDEIDRYGPEAMLIRIGMEYLMAAIRNERRGMHNRWTQAREFIRKIEREVQGQPHTDQFHRLPPIGQPGPPQKVYFIGPASGPVKIGIAAKPMDRLKALQTSHHERLEILATCEGGMEQERNYHTRFEADRLSGEWFTRTPEIEAEIARLQPLSL